jgi:competence protein ComEA
MPFRPRFPELLRRNDQAAAAGLVVLGAAIVVGWLAVQDGTHRRLSEAERSELKTARFQVDVNAADEVELKQLPGVGKALARRIVENRRTLGPFRSVEDLCRVPGIGPKTLEKLRPYLQPVGESQ